MLIHCQLSAGKKAKRNNHKGGEVYRLILDSREGNGANLIAPSLITAAFLARKYESRLGMYVVDIRRPDGSSLFDRAPVLNLPKG